MICPACKTNLFSASERKDKGQSEYIVWCGNVIKCNSYAANDGGRGSTIEKAFEDLWRQVDEAVSGVVDRTTFADLQRSWTEKHDKFVPNWDI
jgi:DNA-binding IscR family transcriptional regulator